MLLNILQHALIVACDEVNSYTFAAKTTTTTNPEKKNQLIIDNRI
jgi:hypothetical protein